MKHAIVAASLSALVALPASAADNQQLQEIQNEIKQMKQDYEARIQALETRLKQAEADAGKAQAKADQAEQKAEQVATMPVPTPPAAINSFNPAVSLILSGLYSNLSHDPANYQITGFHLPNDVMSDVRPQKGFSLTESELGIYANVDPYFYGGLNFSIHPDNTVSTEEAFVQTTALPHGLTVKAGRFFSGIGYLNEQHSHVWDFVDAPLAYDAFLGGQFNNDGVQVRWLAPTDTYLELGAEAGRGANYPGTGRNKNGSGAGAVYAHLGGDIGDSNSWKAGLSYMGTAPRDRQWDDTNTSGSSVTNSFSGNSKLWIADGVWKWAPHGNPYYTNFKLQGEYLRRNEDGTLIYNTGGSATPGHYASTQSGWYLQGIYQFAPYWRVGLRTERLSSGNVDYGVNNPSIPRPDYDPVRHSFMVDYNLSEFSRMRVQVSQDKSQQGVTDNQLFVQYQMSLGAHGAHIF